MASATLVLSGIVMLAGAGMLLYFLRPREGKPVFFLAVKGARIAAQPNWGQGLKLPRVGFMTATVISHQGVWEV